MLRTVIAGIAGAILMFAWAGFAHMATPLGHMGIDEMPNEAPALAALQESLGTEHALYFYPGFGLGHHPNSEEMKAEMPAFKEKLKTNPWGLLVYHPAGTGDVSMTKTLAIEFALELAASLIAAWLLAGSAISGFANRVAFVTAIGVIVAVATNGSYWNWYGFPLDYTLSYAAIQVVGFFVAGIAIAAVLKKA